MTWLIRRRLLRSRASVAKAAAAASLLGLAACQSPSAQRDDKLPSLRDIRRKDPIPEEIAHTIDMRPVQRTPLRLERVDFRLNDSLTEAWPILDATGLSPAIVNAWRVNGMRVGVLKQALASEFVKRLPDATGGNAQIVVPTTIALPLVRSPELDAPVAVDLTVPPRPVREIVLSFAGGSRVQLLIEIVRDAMGRPILIFTPHHFVPQQTLAVRSAEEKALDGRMLQELSLAVLLDRSEALVIGLDVPPPPVLDPNVPIEPPSPQPSDRRDLQQAQPLQPKPTITTDGGQPPPPGSTPGTAPGNVPGSAPGSVPGESTEPTPPVELSVEDRLAPNLGRALFAASRYGRPIQMLYIIRVAE